MIDKTGLPNRYNFSLTWIDELAAAQENGSETPGLSVALEEQLGLKLVPSKAPVEVIVIDRIERPSDN